MSMFLKCLFLVAVIATPRTEAGGGRPCSVITPPEGGKVDCDGGTRHGSTCTLSCEENYDLDGTTETSIEADCYDGTWTESTEFLCNPPASRSCPAITPPRWGVVECDNDLEHGSTCSLSCEKHYDLAGTTEPNIDTVCEDGTWSVSTDFLCNPIRCLPIPHSPENGDRICSANTLAESLCVIYCDQHFDMKDVTTDRTAYTVCKDDGDGDEFGQWEGVGDLPMPPTARPMCEQLKCPFEHKAPENGKMVCSSGSFVGSFCVFACNEGYDFVGTRKAAINSYCADDGNYDNVGKWTRTRIPKCRRTLPGCPPPPYFGGISYKCTSEDHDVATMCKPVCQSSLEELQQGSALLCGKKLRWQPLSNEKPKCTRCKRAKGLQIVAMIHEAERDVNSYNLAVRLITRTMTVLKRKYKFNPTLKVNRYSSKVDTSAGVIFKAFQSKRDKAKIVAVPFAGSEENLEKALGHVSDSLDEGGVRVAMIITNGMNSDAKAQKLALDLRKRGVIILVFILPRNGDGDMGSEADMVKIAGDKSRVFELMSDADAEDVKNEVSRIISDTAVRMGCKNKS